MTTLWIQCHVMQCHGEAANCSMDYFFNFFLRLTAKFTSHFPNNSHLLNTVNPKSNFPDKWVLITEKQINVVQSCYHFLHRHTFLCLLTLQDSVLTWLQWLGCQPWPEGCRAGTSQQEGKGYGIMDVGCWAFLQTPAIPWASCLARVPGAQAKSKEVVILLSNCVSPGF